MARKAEIILTDDGHFVVLGSTTQGAFKLWELKQRNFSIPTLKEAIAVASEILEPISGERHGSSNRRS